MVFFATILIATPAWNGVIDVQNSDMRINSNPVLNFIQEDYKNVSSIALLCNNFECLMDT